MVRSRLPKSIAVLGLTGLLLVGFSDRSEAKTVLLVFSSPHCGPCQQLKPIVDQLVEKGYPIRKVDVTREPKIASQFRVDRVPTLVMISEGVELDRREGNQSADALRKMFASAGVRPERLRAPETPNPSWTSETIPHGIVPPLPPGPVGQVPPATLPSSENSAPVEPNDFQKRLLASSVRITIDDERGKSYGTGTIVDAREGDALIVTCGHLFRGDSAKGKITIELFAVTDQGLRVADRLPGRLEGFDIDRDVGLVSFRTRAPVQVARVAAEFGEQVNDRVWSVGCDLGANPTVRTSHVTAIDRYHGPPNVETAGAPVVGRSGGGLFNKQGELVGVCFAADAEGDEGLYSGLASVHAELDRLGLQNIYASEGPVAPDVVEAPSRLSPLPVSPVRVAQEDVIRGQDPDLRTPLGGPPRQMFPVAPAASAAPVTSLPPVERAAFQEIASRAAESEVVVIVRSREPGGASEVIKLDRVSPQFVEALRSMPTAR